MSFDTSYAVVGRTPVSSEAGYEPEKGEVFQEEYEPEKGRIFSSRLPRVDVVVNSGTPPSSRQLVNECLLFPIELNQF